VTSRPIECMPSLAKLMPRPALRMPWPAACPAWQSCGSSSCTTTASCAWMGCRASAASTPWTSAATASARWRCALRGCAAARPCVKARVRARSARRECHKALCRTCVHVDGLVVRVHMLWAGFQTCHTSCVAVHCGLPGSIKP